MTNWTDHLYNEGNDCDNCANKCTILDKAVCKCFESNMKCNFVDKTKYYDIPVNELPIMTPLHPCMHCSHSEWIDMHGVMMYGCDMNHCHMDDELIYT